MGDDAMVDDDAPSGGRGAPPRFSIFAALRRMAANTEGVTDIDWDAGMCELVDGAATRCFDRQIAPFATRLGGIEASQIAIEASNASLAAKIDRIAADIDKARAPGAWASTPPPGSQVSTDASSPGPSASALAETRAQIARAATPMASGKWARQRDPERLILSGDTEVTKPEIISIIERELEAHDLSSSDYTIGGGGFNKRWTVRFKARGHCSSIEELCKDIKGSYKQQDGVWKDIEFMHKGAKAKYNFEFDKAPRQIRREQITTFITKKISEKGALCGKPFHVQKYKRNGKVVVNDKTVCRVDVDEYGMHKLIWHEPETLKIGGVEAAAMAADVDQQVRQWQG